MNRSESKADQAPIGSFENVVQVDFGKKTAKEGYSIASLDFDPRGEEKRFAFEKLIELGMVMVTLDTRKKGVQVPSRFRNDQQLHLNFSHRFGIEDFRYDDHGVQASLSFHGTAFRCVVPWSAVYIMRSHVDQEVAIFPEDLPAEMQDVASELQKALQAAEELQQKKDALDKAAQAAKPPLRKLDAEKLEASEEVFEAKLGEKSEDVKVNEPRSGLRLVRSE